MNVDKDEDDDEDEDEDAGYRVGPMALHLGSPSVRPYFPQVLIRHTSEEAEAEAEAAEVVTGTPWNDSEERPALDRWSPSSCRELSLAACYETCAAVPEGVD